MNFHPKNLIVYGTKEYATMKLVILLLKKVVRNLLIDGWKMLKKSLVLI